MTAAIVITAYFAFGAIAIAVMIGRAEYGTLPRGLRWVTRLRAGVADRTLKTFYPEVWQKRQGTK